ncbi:MAG: peptidyl-prolyl cis-trans isomerase [Rhodobacteraceae bacterium]|nr:peptidyl-prolyl cis-trans isomerase [Paracoccaceae bacterium]
MAAKGNTSRLLVWILLLMLLVGLAGFGVDSFGGRVAAVGRVGDREISTREYARALQDQIRAFEAQLGQSLPFQTALAFGIDRVVRQNLVTVAALDHETARIGLSVGDDAVHQKLLEIEAFRGVDGKFDREAYRYVLDQNGLDENEFEADLRAEAARTLLQAAVAGGLEAPPAAVAALYAWEAERRSFRLVRLAVPADPVGTPDDAALRAFYEAHIADYTRPEGRRITWAWLAPAALVDSVEVDEGAVRELYDRRLSEYLRPERRLVERLVFATEADARAAMARVTADEGAFAAIVAERGLALADVDMGDVTREELGAAGEAVFALAGPGVVGPLPSPLGPAIFRMNGILAAQETPFDEAREDLRAEIATERARRRIAERMGEVQDLLAGGATVEDLARDLGMELGTIDWREGDSEGIAAYTAFRTAAAGLAEGGFPEPVEFDDGGMAVLRLDALIPAAPQPFEEVEVRVVEDWAAAETAARLAAEGEALATRLRAGEAAETLGPAVESFAEITRDAFVEGVPATTLAEIFAMAPGEVRVRTEGAEVLVAILDAVLPPDPADAEAGAAREAIAARLAGGLSGDLFDQFARALESEAGIWFDDAAIAAVHTQFQ